MHGELPYFIMRCHQQEGLTDYVLCTAAALRALRASVLYSASFLSRSYATITHAATQEATENSHQAVESKFSLYRH
jgi:hypothetical protein